MRKGQRLTQKEIANRAKVTESAHRAYELGDCNPKPEILDRIAIVLGVRPEFLGAPTFRNKREFAYAILENGDAFGYIVRDINGVITIAANHNLERNSFSELVRDWEIAHKRLVNLDIDQKNARSGGVPE